MAKLYYVDGIRHSAVVLAESKDEAVRFAVQASEGKKNQKVLFGHVGSWESPSAIELKLPYDYKIIKKKSRK